MKIYESITITVFGMNHPRNQGYFYLSDDRNKLDISHHLTFEEAQKEMAKLAKNLNKTPTMTINQYDPDICYWTLAGYLN